jgi:hypothetical protein
MSEEKPCGCQDKVEFSADFLPEGADLEALTDAINPQALAAFAAATNSAPASVTSGPVLAPGSDLPLGGRRLRGLPYVSPANAVNTGSCVYLADQRVRQPGGSFRVL